VDAKFGAHATDEGGVLALMAGQVAGVLGDEGAGARDDTVELAAQGDASDGRCAIERDLGVVAKGDALLPHVDNIMNGLDLDGLAGLQGDDFTGEGDDGGLSSSGGEDFSGGLSNFHKNLHVSCVTVRHHSVRVRSRLTVSFRTLNKEVK
jgi:hypothetical protein